MARFVIRASASLHVRRTSGDVLSLGPIYSDPVRIVEGTRDDAQTAAEALGECKSDFCSKISPGQFTTDARWDIRRANPMDHA